MAKYKQTGSIFRAIKPSNFRKRIEYLKTSAAIFTNFNFFLAAFIGISGFGTNAIDIVVFAMAQGCGGQ